MKLQTVKDFCESNTSFKPGGMRHLIFHENNNGYKGCFPRVMKKVFIDVDKFFNRIEELNQNN